MKPANPTFTVVVPTYNRSALLARAVDSVLNQTWTDFELIVVDDASTDDTPQVMAQFSDERLIYIRQPDNQGASAARNTGICRAKGQYVSFLDSDDELLPQFLEQTYRFFESCSGQIGFVWTGIYLVHDTPEGEVIAGKRVWQVDCPVPNQARWSTIIEGASGYGLTVQRDCFEKTGMFDERLPVHHDSELLIRLGLEFDFAVIPSVLLKYHAHDNTRLTDTMSRNRTVDEWKLIQKTHVEQFDLHPRLQELIHYNIVRRDYGLGNKGSGRTFMRQIVKKNPLHVGHWLNWFSFEAFGLSAPGLTKRYLPRNWGRKVIRTYATLRGK